MGSFYSGFGGHKSHLGHCEDGIIYSGRTPIGRYENGNIYNQFKEHVGSYGGGSIYDAFGTHIASYDGGSVYNKYLNAVVGREQVGSYEDNPAEAAALVLLFLGGNSVNSDRDEEDINTTTDSSNDGCLSSLFGLVALAIGGLLKLLWPLLKIFINAFWLTPLIGMSWLGFGCCVLAILSASAGIVPLIVVLVAIYCVIEIAFFPYWLILMWQRIKKHLNWKEVWSYYGKWFFKGPVAYIDLHSLLNEMNTMPKVAGLLGKIIEWFEKVFKKNEKV